MPEPTLSELDQRLKQLQDQVAGGASASNLPVPVGQTNSQAGRWKRGQGRSCLGAPFVSLAVPTRALASVHPFAP